MTTIPAYLPGRGIAVQLFVIFMLHPVLGTSCYILYWVHLCYILYWVHSCYILYWVHSCYILYWVHSCYILYWVHSRCILYWVHSSCTAYSSIWHHINVRMQAPAFHVQYQSPSCESRANRMKWGHAGPIPSHGFVVAVPCCAQTCPMLC